MPCRVAAKKPAQRVVLAAGLLVGPDDAGVGAAAQPQVGALEPERPATMSAVAGPVATTTRSPASRQAVASVASGSRWDA